jgi:lysophospholipase L1-like esterase
VRRRLPSLAALMGLLLVLGGCTDPIRSTPPATGSIGAMGDSITRAFDACTFLADCPTKSWSTGNDPAVASHYSRLLARNAGMAGHAFNVAQVGASSANLPAQAAAIAARRPDYVTMLMGANDACATTEAAMTSPAAFRANVDAALATVYAARPNTRVLVVSIPDIYRLWQVAHTNNVAQLVWSAGFCRTMLDRPTSLAADDENRRLRVRARILDFNTQLAESCAAHAGCRYDGGAVFRYPFTIGQLSPFDYFHPNPAGQKVLSDLTWAASGW